MYSNNNNTVPTAPQLGFMALLIDRQIDEIKVKIRLQTGFSDQIVDI
jgi:hypothetical protein